MNVVNLLGRLTADPEKRESQSGTTVAAFTLAVDRRGKDAGADFIRCKAFGKTADTLAAYMGKGRRCAVTGHISTGSYEDRDGRKIYTTDVIVDGFDFCDSRADSQAAVPERSTRPETRRTVPEQGTLDRFLDVPDGIDLELPFK